MEKSTSLRPLFCRIGSKKSIKKTILELIPEHTIYVEPFLGSGAIFWAKPPSEIEILNDLDKALIDKWKLIKTTPTPNHPITKKFSSDDEITNFYKTAPNTPINKLAKSIIESCNTFSNLGGLTKLYNKGNPFNKINKLDEYKNRLNGVKLLNQSYEKVINKYDSPDTFFYLDPPYENSEGLYDNPIIDYEQMRKVLDKVKGKWLLSINDSPAIRKTFRGYWYERIKVRSSGGNEKTVGSKPRFELVISNYGD